MKGLEFFYVDNSIIIYEININKVTKTLWPNLIVN